MNKKESEQAKDIERLKKLKTAFIALVKLYGNQGVMLDDRDLADVADDDHLIVSHMKETHKTRYRVQVGRS